MTDTVRTIAISADEITPLLEGLAILGNGGGGSPAWGRMILENDIKQGRSWKIVDLDSVPDEWTIVSGGILASVKVLEGISFDTVLTGWEADFPTLNVVRLTEKWLGRKVNAFVPFEPGGLNAPLVMTLSARSDVVAIDGDGLGRACPESQMTSWQGHGVSLTPMPLIDRFGNSVIVIDSEKTTFSDELGRWIVSQGSGMGANTLFPMSGKQLKATTIPGTYSHALKIGQAVLQARAAGRDPIAALADLLGARRLFAGRIEQMVEEERAGFYFTVATLGGQGDHRGQAARLIIKNEAMLFLRDGKPRAMFPDSIYMLEPGSGRGYMSVELKAGMEMVVLTAPCHPRLRAAAQTAIGRQSLGPARYGHPELVYRPLEELLAE